MNARVGANKPYFFVDFSDGRWYNTYTNKYDDAYWNQSVLADFEYSEDILKRADKYNLNNKAYVAPWTALGLEEKDVTLEQRVELGRYREEHNSICKIISTTYDELKVEKRLFETAKEWAEKTTENSVFDWISNRFEYSQEEVEEVEEEPEKNEAEEVENVFGNRDDLNFVKVDASKRFLGKLEGVSDPEKKRKIIMSY